MRLSFGEFVFDGETRELFRGETKVHLPPKTFRMLELLLERRPNAVSKEALMEALWPGVFVGEGNLPRLVAELRGMVGDDAQEPRIIRTVQRFGYAFQAETKILPALQPAGAVAAAPAAPPLAAWRALAVRVVPAAILLVAAGLWGGRALERKSHASPAFRRLTFRRGLVTAARFTPDGQTVVYSAKWGDEPERVFLNRLGSPESQALPLADGTELLGISKAGDLALALRAPRFSDSDEPPGTLGTMPLAGKTPRELLEDVQFADWSPNRTGMAVVHGQRLEFPAGKVLYADGKVGKALFSPRGDRIAVLEVRGGQLLVSVVDLAGRRTELARVAPALGSASAAASHVGLAWSPGGDEIWYAGGVPGTSNAVTAVSLAGRSRVLLSSTSFPVVRDVASDGRLLLAMGEVRGVVLYSGGGERGERDLGWFSMSSAIALSRDGGTVLLNEYGEGGGREGAAYLRKTDGAAAFKVADGRVDAMSPDARWVARVREGKATLIPTGTGDSRVLSDADFAYEGVTWFPDGRRLLVAGRETGHESRLYLQDAGGGPRSPFSTEGLTGDAAISPDGTLVSVAQTDGLWVYPVAGGSRRPLPGLSKNEFVLSWTEDVASVFVTENGPLPFRIFRVNVATGRRELWKTVAPGDPAGICDSEILMLPNGTSVMNVRRWTNDLYLVDGVK